MADSRYCIRVLGPGEIRSVRPGEALVINTTSRSPQEWTSGLSPFRIGPCRLPCGRWARIMENAWQFSKVYPRHLDDLGEPSPTYWAWARQGWLALHPVRYPMGKGARPAYCLFDGQKLAYVPARLGLYWPLYRDAVAQTPAFQRLADTVHRALAISDVVLFDFDGFDHQALGMTFGDVLMQDRRPMGHGFVLKAMLELGHHVTPDDVLRAPEPCPPASVASTQGRLF